MINFTVGPVQASDLICSIGSEQIPYFRTSEFSSIMLENEYYIKKFANAPNDSRVVFITGSGTASMEAAIMNTLTSKDKAIIVNGGSFGQRFVDLCKIHDIPFSELKLEFGKKLSEEELLNFENKGFTAFIVNIHETSTGVYYDKEVISNFCRRNNLFLIVDAISSFLADPFDMEALNVDVMITGSQKALACPPGISVITLSEQAIKRINNNSIKCMYLNLKDALLNGERGQTPFTPAVGILRQINARLKEIDSLGGVENEIKRISGLADDFRRRVKDFPFSLFSESMSNAVTALHPLNTSAYSIFIELKDNYDIWVCPNGGSLRDEVFRVGHIGMLTVEDNDKLFSAFADMQKKGLI